MLISFCLKYMHYTIGDSAPAPMFKVIEQPNDFAKTAKSLANKSNLNESQIKREEYFLIGFILGRTNR